MPTSTPTSTTREIKQGVLDRLEGCADDIRLKKIAGIAPVFRRYALRDLLEMRDALSRRERERLILAANNMKGSSRRLGLLRLSSLCDEVERLAREDAFAAAALALRQMAAEYRQVQTVLDEWVAGEQASDIVDEAL